MHANEGIMQCMNVVDQDVEKQVVGLELVCNAIKGNEKTEGIVDEALEPVSEASSEERERDSPDLIDQNDVNQDDSESFRKEEEHLIRQIERIKAGITRPDLIY